MLKWQECLVLFGHGELARKLSMVGSRSFLTGHLHLQMSLENMATASNFLASLSSRQFHVAQNEDMLDSK